MTATEERYLTVAELADEIRLHPDTIRRLARTGDIPCEKWGNRYRFIASEVHAARRPEIIDDWAMSSQSRHARRSA